MRCPSISLCVIIAWFGLCYGKKLPSYITKCKRDYPQVNECIIQRVNELRPRLEKGIPELKLPALKPLRLPKVEFNTENGTSGGFDIVVTDLVIEGAEDFQVKKLDFDVAKGNIDLGIYIPRMRIQSQYRIKGKLLLFDLDSSGPSEINITEINSKSHSSCKIVTTNGKQYLDIKTDLPTLTFAKPSIYFGNIFKGNQELTENTNKAINDNIDEIGKDIKPLIDQTTFMLVDRVIKNVFRDYTLDELFD